MAYTVLYILFDCSMPPADDVFSIHVHDFLQRVPDYTAIGVVCVRDPRCCSDVFPFAQPSASSAHARCHYTVVMYKTEMRTSTTGKVANISMVAMLRSKAASSVAVTQYTGP